MSWQERAACADIESLLDHDASPDDFHPDRDATGVNRALAVCAVCPVRAECGAEAVTHGHSGIWGGAWITERGKVVKQTLDNPACRERRGSEAGYKRHQAAGQYACDPCRDANRQASARRRVRAS